MKKIVHFTTLLLVSSSAWGQTTVGVTASGFTNQVRVELVEPPGFTGSGTVGIENKPGFSAGGFIRHNFNSWLVTRTELNYVNTGYKSREPYGNKLTGIFTVNYLQVIPMIGLYQKQGFSLTTGPTLNLHIGSSARQPFSIVGTPPGSYTILDEWTQTRGLLNSPPGQDKNSGVTERFVLGWQVQFGYVYKRWAIHANRQWPLKNPMGNTMFNRSIPQLGRNDYFFSSWQYGLSYQLFGPKYKAANAP